MSTDLATYYVNVVPTTKGIGGTLVNEMGDQGEQSGKAYGNRFASIVKKLIMAAGIGKVMKEAINQGAALEQSIGGIETMFKGTATRMQDYAAQAYQTAGVSANTYMEQVTSFSARLLQGLKGNTEQAATIANMAMVDMSDNANKYGTDITSIQNAYQGFAKQNFTMLDNLKLGYGGTASEMARLINDSGVLGKRLKVDAKTLKDVPFDKMILAIHKIQEEWGVTGTTAYEAAHTYTGSLNSMKAAWENLLGYVSIGSDRVGDAIGALATTVVNYANNAIPMILKIIKNLPSALLTVITEIAPSLLQQIGQLITDIIINITFSARSMLPQLGQLFLGIGDYLWELIPRLVNDLANMVSIVGMHVAKAIPTAIKEMLPRVLEFTSQLREKIGVFIDSGIEMIMGLVQGFVEALPDLIAYVPEIVINIADTINDNMPKILKMGWDIIVTLIKGIIDNIPNLIANAGKIVEAIWATISAISWMNLGSQLLTKIKDGILKKGPELLSKAGNLFLDIVSGVEKINWLDVGKNIIKGIGKGITSLGSWLVDSAVSVAKSAFNGMKKWLGIKSPSKLAETVIGKNWALGIGEGFDKYMPTDDMIHSLGNSFDDVAKSTVGSFESDIALAAANNANMLNGLNATNLGTTTNYGGVAINVYAQKEESARELAEQIMEIIQSDVSRRRMAFE